MSRKLYMKTPVNRLSAGVIMLQVRNGSIEVRPRLVALDNGEKKAYFSDGTNESVRVSKPEIICLGRILDQGWAPMGDMCVAFETLTPTLTPPHRAK